MMDASRKNAEGVALEATIADAARRLREAGGNVFVVAVAIDRMRKQAHDRAGQTSMDLGRGVVVRLPGLRRPWSVMPQYD